MPSFSSRVPRLRPALPSREPATASLSMLRLFRAVPRFIKDVPLNSGGLGPLQRLEEELPRSRRAHNSTFPADFEFAGISYLGPTELFHSVVPRPEVGLSTFMGRLSKLKFRGELTEDAIREALHLPADDYRAKYGARKTWIRVAGNKIDLESFYRVEMYRAAVPYRTFWARLRRSRKKEVIDQEIIEHALLLSTPDWISFYGGGRHRSFIYSGEIYPEHHGEAFHGISAFLKTIGRYSERSTIWSRLKAGWDLDTALTLPVDVETERTGLIYKLTRIRTGQVYVGLTLTSLEQRWFFHLQVAQKGSTSKLAEAIRQDGPDGFRREVIEEGIETPERLREREVFWALQLEALGPGGLNTAKPGAMGSGRGVPTEWQGETFPSRTEAALALSRRTGLAPHVVESRLRSGAPLPAKARVHSRHPEAGSNLFRRWLALVKRHPGNVDPAWVNSYDSFKSDVEPSFVPGFLLSRIDASRPWGPDNWEWTPAQHRVERMFGEAVTIRGVEYPSLKAAAAAFGIGVSTLKDRMRRQGQSPEEAVERPLGATSYRTTEGGTKVDGRIFRSKRQAILYIAASRGITEGQAKYRLERGDFS